MKTRYLALLLVALMLVGLFAGCAKAPAETPVDTPAATTPTDKPTDTPADAPADEPADVPADEPADAPADEPTDEPVAETPYLPLVSEPATLTIWGSSDGFVDIADDATLNNSPYWTLVAEQTGVTAEFATVSSAAASEQFSLMLVSGDYEDIINYQARYFPNGMANAIDEEIVVDVAPYIEAGLAPHYQAIRESDERVRMDTQLDDGRISGFYRILDTYQDSWMGPIIAQELAAQAGVSDVNSLVSLTDWHDMLLTMSQQDNVEIAIELSVDGFDPVFLSCFDIPRGYSYDNNFRHVGDTVEYSFITQDFYNYLTTLKQWYEEGIFDSEFYGFTGFLLSFGGQDIVARGGVGVMRSIGSMIPLMNTLSGLSYVGIPGPLQDGATKRNVAMTDASFSRVEQNHWAITPSCEDIELAVRFADYFYSDEAFMPLNYGMEGECYTINEEGEPVFTDMMAANPDNIGYMTLIAYYGGFGSAVGRYTWTAQFNNMDPIAVDCYAAWDRTWDRSTDLYTLPLLSLTQEESETYSNTFSDIQTYVNEMTIKFIIGQEELSEASYAAYVDNIKSMRIDECTEILQAAYDRYLQR